MNGSICDLCGNDHAVQDCKLFFSQEKVTEVDVQPQILLPFQTLPSWVYIQDNPKKLITCREIEKSFKIGPYLAPQSSSLNKNIDFPLYVQIFNACRLWIDQSDISKCNWLSLIPASPFYNNLVACQIGESIYYVVTKPIKVGEELKVWYAPFYKTKIPPEVLERVTLSHEKIEKDSIETDNDKSSTQIIVRDENGDDVDTLTNSTSILNENQILIDSSFIPNNIVNLGNGPSSTQGLVAGSVSNPKVLSSCPVSLSSSLTAILSAGTASSSSYAQPMFLVSTSFPNATLNSINLEPSVYNCLPLNSKQNELIPVSHQSTSHRLCQNGTESICVPEIQMKDNPISTFTSENMTLEVLKEFNQDNSSETEHFSNHISDESYLNVRTSLPLDKHFNLPSLQHISISNSKITFTHQFSDKILDNTVTNSEEDGENATYKHKSNEKKNNSHRMIFVKTGLRKRNIKTSAFVEPLGKMSNIELSDMDVVEDLDNSYEMVSLCVSKTSSQTPVSEIIKKQKRVNPNTKETLHKGSKNSFASVTHWTCSQCTETFSETLTFALHLKNHVLVHLGKRLVCDVCGFCFKDANHFEAHVKSHSVQEETPDFKRDQDDCSNESDSVGINSTGLPITQDNRQIKGSRNRNWHGNFNCPICSRRFTNGKYLLRHLARHSGEFVCTLCKKEFTRNESLRKHVCLDQKEIRCSLCTKTFSSFLSYKLHSYQHNENVRCCWCFKVFVSESSLHKHQIECMRNPDKNKEFKERTVEGSSKFCCHICNRDFSTLFFLKNHAAFCKQLAAVSEKGQVNCETCGFLCATSTQLRLHLQTHTHPYLCLGCSLRFRSRGTYELHICGIDFSCDFCGCVLRSLQELYKHITIHGPSPWCCSRCRFPFYKNESLKDHRCLVEVKALAEANERRKVRCPFCPSLFTSEHNLKKHMASLHDVPMKQKFECGDCGKHFHRSDLLKTHEKTHLAPSLECHECHKRFKSQKSFANHSVSHNKDFRFTCRHCHKGFAQKKDILRHERTHSFFMNTNVLSGNFKCQPCKIQFSCSENLDYHLSSQCPAAPLQTSINSKPRIKV